MAWTNDRDRALRNRAERVIPGGMYGHESTALLPADFPQFFSRAKGARLWDADGNEYVDYMCASGPTLLGYGFEPVEAAARAQQASGRSRRPARGAGLPSSQKRGLKSRATHPATRLPSST